MLEQSLSFEQIDVQANRGMRPEGSLDHQQYTRDETIKVNEEAEYQKSRDRMITHEIEDRLKPFQEEKYEEFAVRFLRNALTRNGITPETHPEVVALVTQTLDRYAQAWMDKRMDNFAEYLRIPYLEISRQRVKFLIDDLEVLEKFGIDVSAYAYDILARIEATLNPNVTNKKWSLNPTAQIEQLNVWAVKNFRLIETSQQPSRVESAA